jgi:prophage antirepressor-like protein
MDIVKALVFNEEINNINIIGTYEEPLFQANQVAKILEIKNINSIIKFFDNDEKIIKSTNESSEEILFLTIIGLYRLVGMSRKPIAKKLD